MGDIFDFLDREREEKAFHARAHMPAAEIAVGQARAEKQNAAVLEIFRDRPGVLLTPWEVFDVLKGQYPITSVRRAMTTLSKGIAAPLVHHEHDRRQSGPYGATSSSWSLAE